MQQQQPGRPRFEAQGKGQRMGEPFPEGLGSTTTPLNRLSPKGWWDADCKWRDIVSGRTIVMLIDWPGLEEILVDLLSHHNWK